MSPLEWRKADPPWCSVYGGLRQTLPPPATSPPGPWSGSRWLPHYTWFNHSQCKTMPSLKGWRLAEVDDIGQGVLLCMWQYSPLWIYINQEISIFFVSQLFISLKSASTNLLRTFFEQNCKLINTCSSKKMKRQLFLNHMTGLPEDKSQQCIDAYRKFIAVLLLKGNKIQSTINTFLIDYFIGKCWYWLFLHT
jgi:hypothetical protein